MIKNPNRKHFYQKVNLRSRSAMIRFLEEHFRYCTMNSWNYSTSYACNLKITNLGLDSDTVGKLLDMMQVEGFYDELYALISDFNAEHQYLWQAGWNGRSGGYLVLYQGASKPGKYRSYCTNCGHENYASVAETGCRCVICNKDTRIDYKTPPRNVVCYPGKGTDQDEDFSEWNIYGLRERVKLVQEFDQLADDIIERSLELAAEYSVVEETVYVPTTRLVLAQEVAS